MDFQILIDRTIRINNRFKAKLGKRGRVLSLMNEVGELADAVLIYEGHKPKGTKDKQKSKEDITDALSDILYNLITIAEHYDADLAKEYGKMLDSLDARFTEGEFVAKVKE